MSVESAKLEIRCEPEINATVILNGEDTGKQTPVEFTLIKGEYQIELRLPEGYALFEWWKDNLPLTKEPIVTINLDKDTVLLAKVVTAQQQMVTETSTAMMNLMIVIVILLMVVSLIKELMGAIGSLRR